MFDNIKIGLDIIILIIPALFVLILIIKYVIPKHPVFGIGLAGGVGLISYFLVHRRLEKAFFIEKKVAEHNEMMEAFKNKQKTRHNLVMANNRVINALEKKRKKLSKNEEKYRNEIKLIDAELTDRRKLNEQVLSDSHDFLKSLEKPSQQRKELIKQAEAQMDLSGMIEPASAVTNDAVIEPDQIQINGYRLWEV